MLDKKPREDHRRPKHYLGKDDPYEPWKVFEAWDPEHYLGFCRFNAIKYLMRAGKKPGVSPQMDYDKAEEYAKEAAALNRRLHPKAHR